MNNNFTVPAKIIEAIKAKKLLVFVGAGMSIKFHLPDWNKMAIDVIKDTAIPEYQDYITVLEKNLFEPLSVLDKIENEKHDIYSYIEKNFVINKEQDLETHKNLIKISGKIVTTNYDNAFEVSKEGIYTITHSSTYKISNISNQHEYVFKIHGSASNDPSKCIVFTRDYEQLYSGESAAIFKMKELFINNTILFIGFGFADPYVNKLFSTMDNLFEGNHTHYLLTTTADKFASLKYIKPIGLTSYSQIDEFVNKCLLHTSEEPKEIALPSLVIEQKSIRKIAVLYPNCIDLPELKQAKALIGCFENLETELYKGFLNMRVMQELDDFDMIFIVTTSYKGKLYIEGEDLKSQLVSVEDIIAAIPNDAVPSVVISDIFVEVDNLINTACIASYKNEILNKFIYKLLRNNEKTFINDNVKIGNFKNDLVYSKSKYSLFSLYNKNNNINFSNKSTESLVGRIEEQASISRKLVSIIDSKKILNIKGAGGTGKTTLVKKVSYSLYERGYFEDGVTFVSCEQVSSFKIFEELISNAFRLANVYDFKNYLSDNNYRLNSLIILDNFETITSLADKLIISDIYNLLEFITDFICVVITSRETLNVDFEDVYALSSMVTDDALALFKQHYGEILESEITILRHDILENLLNNNPLAIKIVTKSSLKQKSVLYLREQLKDSFFESTSLDFDSIFNKKADINIERTKSIFQSINYSYCKLPSKEKLAFEMLHLFPDGINVSNFKLWFNKTNVSNKISDTDLRALNDKSLIEGSDGILQLQPIVRRFAEFQFNKKGTDAKKVYYSEAYSYNAFVLNHIDDVYIRNVNASLKVHNIFKNNLTLALEYVEYIDTSDKSDVSKQHLLNYAISLIDYFTGRQRADELSDKLPKLIDFFSDIEYSKELLKVEFTVLTYYNKDFNDTYRELCKIYKPEEMDNRDVSTEHRNETKFKNTVSTVHSMEGYTIQYVSSIVKNIDAFNVFLFDTDLFYLGIHDRAKEESINFHTFQRAYAHNKLDVQKLESYIKSIFVDYHLEIMQSTYVLSKVKPISYDSIKKLVVTNPYSAGLKELMFAFNSRDDMTKEKHFINAIKKLYHIKYYYLEAIYYYCKFLYKKDDSNFELKYHEGLSLCQKYYYQYLEFRFNNIKEIEKRTYKCNFSYYPIPSLENFVNKYIISYKKAVSKRLHSHR